MPPALDARLQLKQKSQFQQTANITQFSLFSESQTHEFEITEPVMTSEQRRDFGDISEPMFVARFPLNFLKANLHIVLTF